jgi:hypothetical protein
MIRPRLGLALVHYPVLNRRGEAIGSALTNLDLHDIARAARTFGVCSYWVVTPFAEQQHMAEEIIGHWQEGYGAQANPDRGEALSLVRICSSLAEAIAGMNASLNGEKATVVATCARCGRETLPFCDMRSRLWQGEPFLLLLGTGWGPCPGNFGWGRCGTAAHCGSWQLQPPFGAFGHSHSAGSPHGKHSRLLGQRLCRNKTVTLLNICIQQAAYSRHRPLKG